MAHRAYIRRLVRVGRTRDVGLTQRKLGDRLHQAEREHAGLLRRAGIVTALPRGREVLYGLATDQRGIEEARAYFETMSRGWDRALAAFKAFAEAEPEDEA